MSDHHSTWKSGGPPRRPGVSFVLSALFAVLGLAIVVVTAARGDLPRALFLLAGAVAMGHFAGYF